MSNKKYTPIQHLYSILQIIKKTDKRKGEDKINDAFRNYFELNIEKYLEEEKNFIIEAYDLGNDPYKMHRTETQEITKGQEFFLNNFINL
jgi:CRISPR/Cas system-associated endonuclease/helicase Cas3